MLAPRRLLLMALISVLPIAAAHAQAPMLTPVSDVTLNAGGTASVNVVATGAADRQITLSASLPAFASLESPTIGIGQVVTTITLAPSDIDVGGYTAAVTATTDGLSQTEIFTITVNPAGSDLAPVVSAPALRDAASDAALGFTVSVDDPDGAGVASLAATSLPAGADFTPDAVNLSGAFSWTPGAADAGEYDVVFTATSTNGLSGSAVTHIRVAGPPELMIVPIDDVSVPGGGMTTVNVDASGLPDATIILAAALPSFATFNPPGTGIGSVSTTITVSPPAGSAGTYHASVTATSNGEFVTEPFDIIVTGDGPVNHPPTISAPSNGTAAVGEPFGFVVTASDPDGDMVDLFGSALPDGATFTDNGDNTGTFAWTPVAGQEGGHLVTFGVDDNRGGTSAASTWITVTPAAPVNQPPTVSAPAALGVEEGSPLTFQVTSGDPDGDPVALSADALPAGADFTDHGDGTGTFAWTPDVGQAGAYVVTFNGDDGRGGSGSANTVVTVVASSGPGDCIIDGDTDVCAGHTTELCGPEGAASYVWTGPDGFEADTRCITVGAAGTYELTAVDAQGFTSVCSATVTVSICGIGNCPRGPGFWNSQCAQRGNGSTKFDRDQMDQITARVDDASEFFDWSDDFDGFCAVVDPPRPMDVRKQALRMYAVLLANVCAGELGLVPSNGETVSLDPATEIECDLDAVWTISDLINAAEARLAQYDGAPLNPAVRHVYEQLKDCMEGINDGDGIGPTCQGHDSDGDDDHGGGDDDHGGGDDDHGNGGDDPGAGGDTDGSGVNAGGGAGDNQSGDAGQGAIGTLDPGQSSQGLSLKAWPNPLNPYTELSFSLSRGGNVMAAVYDIQGRLVKTLMSGYRSTGEQRVRWDGSDTHGQRVSSGVYFIRVMAPEGEVGRRVTLVK